MMKHVGSSPWKFSERRMIFEAAPLQEGPAAQPQRAAEQEEKTLAHTVQELGRTLTDFFAEKRDTEKQSLAERVRNLLQEVKSKIAGAPENAKRSLKEKWTEVQQRSEEIINALPPGAREQVSSTIEFVSKHLENITQDVRSGIQKTFDFSEAIGKQVGTLFAGVQLPEWMQAFWKDTQELGAWIGRTVQGFIDNFLVGLDEKDATGKYQHTWLRPLFAAQIPAARKRLEEASKVATPGGVAHAPGSNPETPQVSLEQFGLSTEWKVDTARRIPPQGIFDFGPLEGGKRLYKIDTRNSPIQFETSGARYEVATLPIGVQLFLTPKIHSGSFSTESILTFTSPASSVEQTFTLREIRGITAAQEKSSGDVSITVQRLS